MFELIKFHSLNDILLYYRVPLAVMALCVLVAFVAALVDLGIATYVTRVLKVKLSSAKLKRTLWKVIEYLAFLILAGMADLTAGLFTFYPCPLMTVVATIVVLGIETLSVRETLGIAKSAVATIPEIMARIVTAKSLNEAGTILRDFNELPRNKLNQAGSKAERYRSFAEETLKEDV